MKVGDLVYILAGSYEREIGIIYKFDLDDDPVVYHLTSKFNGEASGFAMPYYRFHVKVFNESKSR